MAHTRCPNWGKIAFWIVAANLVAGLIYGLIWDAKQPDPLMQRPLADYTVELIYPGVKDTVHVRAHYLWFHTEDNGDSHNPTHIKEMYKDTKCGCNTTAVAEGFLDYRILSREIVSPIPSKK